MKKLLFVLAIVSLASSIRGKYERVGPDTRPRIYIQNNTGYNLYLEDSRSNFIPNDGALSFTTDNNYKIDRLIIRQTTGDVVCQSHNFIPGTYIITYDKKLNKLKINDTVCDG